MITTKNGHTPETSKRGLFSWLTRLWSSDRTGPDPLDGTLPSPSIDLDAGSLEDEGAVFGGGQAKTANGDQAAEKDLEVAGFASAVWALGRADASLGQGDGTAQAALTSKTELDWLERQIRAKQRLHENTSKLGVLALEKTQHEKAVERLRGRRWHLGADPYVPPESKVAVMAGVYLATAVAAFVAELPLAMSLVSSGFRMQTEAFVQLTSRSNLAFAVVLCLFSLAFKILYESIGGDTAFPADGEAELSRRAKWGRRGMSAIRLGVVLLCFFTLGSLGMLRVFAERAESLEARFAPVAQSTGLTAAQIAERTAAEQHRSFTAAVALTLLTVTLPAFGALCLYAGSALRNQQAQDQAVYRRLRQEEKRLAACRDKIAVITADIETTQHRYNDENKRNEIKDAWLKTRLNIYNHGYERGKVLPEDRTATAGLYDVHTEALKRLAKRRLREFYAKEVSHATEASNGAHA